jgi:hypothetical protein
MQLSISIKFFKQIFLADILHCLICRRVRDGVRINFEPPHSAEPTWEKIWNPWRLYPQNYLVLSINLSNVLKLNLTYYY